MTPQQQQALDELATKTLSQIQTETAYTWAYRAWAAKMYAEEAENTNNLRQCVRFMHDETECKHEALEHAALTGNDDVLQEVRQIMAGGR